MGGERSCANPQAIRRHWTKGEAAVDEGVSVGKTADGALHADSAAASNPGFVACLRTRRYDAPDRRAHRLTEASRVVVPALGRWWSRWAPPRVLLSSLVTDVSWQRLGYGQVVQYLEDRAYVCVHACVVVRRNATLTPGPCLTGAGFLSRPGWRRRGRKPIRPLRRAFGCTATPATVQPGASSCGGGPHRAYMRQRGRGVPAPAARAG